jgi:hypothetical protein
MERRCVLLSGTIPERAAELRPIPCPHCQGQQQGKRSSSLKKYSAIHVQGEAPEYDDSSRDGEFIHRLWQVQIPVAGTGTTIDGIGSCGESL